MLDLTRPERRRPAVRSRRQFAFSAAIAASTELMSKAWPGSQGGTYGGNAVACAAAVATLDVIDDEDLVVQVTDDPVVPDPVAPQPGQNPREGLASGPRIVQRLELPQEADDAAGHRWVQLLQRLARRRGLAGGGRGL